jgi:hypothetical protein
LAVAVAVWVQVILQLQGVALVEQENFLLELQRNK